MSPKEKHQQKFEKAFYQTFVLKQIVKQIAPHENNAGELSFKWSHFRIASINSKVRPDLHSIINRTTSSFLRQKFAFNKEKQKLFIISYFSSETVLLCPLKNTHAQV